MPSAVQSRWSIAAAVLVAAVIGAIAIPLLGGEPLDRIEARPVASAPRAAAPAPAAAPLIWTLPSGWTVAPTQPMRHASFAVDGGGSCGLFIFAGGGDRLANVNRWRGQAGLALIDATALDQALVAGTCGFGPFHWLSIRGDKAAFLAAIIATPGGQCFVKLEAAGDRLAAMQDGFLAFVASLRPGDQAP